MSLPPDIWRKIILEDIRTDDRDALVAVSRTCGWWFKLIQHRRSQFGHEKRIDATHFIGTPSTYDANQEFMGEKLISFRHIPPRRYNIDVRDFNHKYTITLYINSEISVYYHFGYRNKYKHIEGTIADITNVSPKGYVYWKNFCDDHYIFNRECFEGLAIAPNDIDRLENLWKYVMDSPGIIATLLQS